MNNFFIQKNTNFLIFLILLVYNSTCPAEKQNPSSLNSQAVNNLTINNTDTKNNTDFNTQKLKKDDELLPKASYLPQEVLALSDDQRLSTTVLIADKIKRKLSVFDKSSLDINQFKQQFDIDIGKNDGPKLKRDDSRTPEGIYLLESKKSQPEIPFEKYGAMAFTTNYPNFFDKFESKTGDGIWLHSVPDSIPLTRGSKGCVVLRNDDIKKVEPFITLGKTFLIINNQIKWLSEQNHLKEKQLALSWLDNWKSLWETQSLDNYIDNYANDFSAPVASNNTKDKYTKSTWLKHKKDLKERYKFVKISLSSPHVFQHKDQYFFQFIQNYESDGHKDTGIKNLYVIKNGSQLKIHREEWFGIQ